MNEIPQVAQGARQRHLLTVALEDYFQVGAFNQLIQRGEWYRFEARLERGTLRTLDLLDEFRVRATFFALGWVADNAPELIRLVADRGHEVASKGYYHRRIRDLSPGEFREDLARAREALERASGQRVIGYRLADGWFGPQDVWALDVLASEGYEYDSSIGPIGRRWAAEPWRRFAHAHQFGDRTLWEFPISSTSVFGFLIPIAGGNYFRQLPHALVKRAVAHWMRTYSSPFVMYFHTWELDPDQPKISAAPALQRVRQYRNLHKLPMMLREYLVGTRFTGVADYLGLGTRGTALAAAAPREDRPAPSLPVQISTQGADLLPVTIVVPCYNEELILPYLANTLRSVQDRLQSRYDLRFVFVDDASTDGTWAALGRIFGSESNTRIVQHGANRGVAQAILTGLRHAETEVVCSIDCDCTYDPHELGRMLPLLTSSVDLVTASPYHPQGGVRNVPRWRLGLSRGLSALYRLVLHNKLHTYTSCFRAYRRSRVAGLTLERTGFLGIAETLGRIDLAGGSIVEFPTILEVRLLGRSKMKIPRTILGHLFLLAELGVRRVTRRVDTLPPLAQPSEGMRDRVIEPSRR